MDSDSGSFENISLDAVSTISDYLNIQPTHSETGDWYTLNKYSYLVGDSEESSEEEEEETDESVVTDDEDEEEDESSEDEACPQQEEDEFFEDERQGARDRVARKVDQSTTEYVDEEDPYADTVPTTLVEAVEEDFLVAVEPLLDTSSPMAVYTALILSITMGRDHITATIIHHRKYREIGDIIRSVARGELITKVQQSRPPPASHDGDGDEGEDADDAEEEEDEPTTCGFTPLMLACLKNNFEVVKLLMANGERIKDPHSIDCKCNKCTAITDGLKKARTRLYAYQALCSDPYVVFASKDPIYRAFQLGQKMKYMANQEKHYKAEYLKLVDQCAGLSCRILDHVMSGSELDIVLNEKSGGNQTHYVNLARLKLAVHYQEKQFIAHPACQKKLATLWMGSLNPAVVNSIPRALMFMMTLAIFYPLAAVAYWIYPKGKLSRIMQSPIIKFTANTSSYMVFVALVIALSITEKVSSGELLSEHPVVGPLYWDYVNNTANPLITDRRIRTHTLAIPTLLLCVWLLGLIWESTKKIFKERTAYFSDNNFNLLNFLQLLLYIVSFAFRFKAFDEVLSTINYFSDAEGWESLSRNDTTALDRWHWFDADREHWRADDPTVISEAVFAVGSILTICKITYAFTVSERIGPLVISLAQMVEDVLAFMMIFFFIIIAFCVGFHNVYWYFYTGIPRIDGQPPPSEFAGISDVIELFFWSIFGLGKFDAAATFTVVTKGLGTNLLGNIMFATYNWVMVIIMVNMLIGMMARSYSKISEQEDTEWKFARTKLFLEYVKPGSTLPSPFNVVPTWKGVWLLNNKFANDWCYRLAGRIPPKEMKAMKEKGLAPNKKNSFMTFSLRSNSHNEGPSPEYKKVLLNVVKRFSSKGGLGQDNERAGLQRLQKDISSLRQEVIQNAMRQAQDRATMASQIHDLGDDVVNSRAAFTRQHAHLKAVSDQSMVDMKSNMDVMDNHMNRVLNALSSHIDNFEACMEAKISTFREDLTKNINDVTGGIQEINKGVEHQRENVNKIQDTLKNQVESVTAGLQGSLGGLQTHVSEVRGTLIERRFSKLGKESHTGVIEGDYDTEFCEQ